MKDRRTALLLGVLAVFGVATGAGAAAKRPTDPPPPKTLSATDLDQWFYDYIVSDDYAQGGFLSGIVMLYQPQSVELDGDGTVRAVLRAELPKAMPTDGRRTRSIRSVTAFDCKARRIRLISGDAYPQSNLQGRPQPVDASKQDWSAPATAESEQGGLVSRVCSVATAAKTGVDRAKAFPPPLNGLEESAAKDWMARHIDAKGYTPALITGGVGIYFDKTTVGRAKSGRPTVWVRYELTSTTAYDAVAWRSTRQQQEFDCRGRRSRALKTEVYPASNLIGTAHVPESPPGWIEEVAGDSVSGWLETVCLAIGEPWGPVDPKAPAPTAGTPAWVAALNTNRYVVGYQNETGVWLYGLDDMAMNAEGRLLATLRNEYVAPMKQGDTALLSSTSRLEVDCKTYRSRVLESAGYALNDLKGARVAFGGGDWQKPPPAGSAGGDLGRELCGHVSLLSGDVEAMTAMPTPLKGDDKAAVEAWIDDNVDAAGYGYIAYSDEGAVFYSMEEGERTRQDYLRVWIRIEQFRPTLDEGVLFRSMRLLSEYDCEQGRSRLLAGEAYPGSNLQGAKIERKAPDPQWEFIRPKTMDSETLAALCSLKDQADDDAATPGMVPTPTGHKTL